MLSDLSDSPCLANLNGHKPHEPGGRRYNRLGGRPGLDVDFKAVCDAVTEARNGSGETMTDIAARFGVSRGPVAGSAGVLPAPRASAAIREE